MKILEKIIMFVVIIACIPFFLTKQEGEDEYLASHQ
jgi:hypothetical protein